MKPKRVKKAKLTTKKGQANLTKGAGYTSSGRLHKHVKQFQKTIE